MSLLGLSPDRVPDREVADRTFYFWRSPGETAHWDRPDRVVGRRLHFPETDRERTHHFTGFILTQAIEGSAVSWPGRLFRVGKVGGLLRRSFHASCDIGWCGALTILEELPATLAFGPGGECAAAITTRAGSLTVEQIEAMGAVALTFGSRPATDPMRDSVKDIAARLRTKATRTSPRNPDPMDVHVTNRWIELAFKTDRRIGNLVWEWDKIDPHFAFVRDSWTAALFAYVDALKAALWSDLLEPEVQAWLNAPWVAGMAAMGGSGLAPSAAPTNG